MLSREERIFSELLLARGLVARDFIEGYAKKKSGDGSEPSLAEVLIDSGNLGKAEAEEALEEARAIDGALAPHLSEGARLGEFHLIREIGRGGMGIVYEAEQESLGRRVAVKVLPAGAALDERLAIRFLREARATARLQHPGIVPVFASGRTEGVLFYAMELIDGRSLAEEVAEGPLAPERAARVTAEVARALDHAHEAKLIHRDVKPENILLASDGRALLTDFGLVHESLASSFTLPRHVLGTPAYIAPEQALGNPVDRRSDIYALGAVLYTLLCGKPPYAGEVPSIVLSQVLSAPPASLLSLRPDVPAALAAICERAMARKPEDRYATAAQLAEDLEAFGRGDGIVSMAPPVRSRPVGRLLGAAAILAPAGLITLILLQKGFSARVQVVPEGSMGSTTIFSPSASPPPNTYATDPFQAEMGVKFRADTCGYVTGIRFFKDRRNDGSHVGHLWTSAGALLATVVFTGETTEGWQEARFYSPVRIAPNTTYVASYLTGAGKGWNQQPSAFKAAGIDRPPLHALEDGVDGCNGVFKSGPPRDAGGFPDRCASESNFFVDVVFREIACGSNTDPTFVLVNASPGAKTRPSFSPDGKVLAYSTCTGGGCEAWLQELSTGDIVKLATGRFAPAFSPDGRSVAFGTAQGVDVLNLDGRTIDERTIRHLAAPVSSPHPTWSPTGGEVVFSEGDTGKVESSRRGIWIGEIASRRVRLLTSMDARELAYSPHGLRIAFVSRTGGAVDVWTIRSDGGGADRLTSDAAFDWSPFWSSDGRRIYFGSDRSGSPQLWSVEVEEATGRPIGSPKPALNVVFPATFCATSSVDGGQLAITPESTDGRLFRFPFDPVLGTLTSPPVAWPRHPRAALAPQVSPDQKRLVYQESSPTAHLAIVSADGSGESRLITGGAFEDGTPRWSPDGAQIAFQSNRSGGSEVWTVRPDGSDLRQVTRTNGNARTPVWSPDGTRLAYTVDGRDGQLIAARAGALDSPEALPSCGSERFEPWSWSPDGGTLAGSAAGILLYSIGDGSYRRITDFGRCPVWLSDGRHLLFVSERKIFMIDSDGGKSREVYSAAPAGLRPYLSVSGDGRMIYASLSAVDEQIWIAPLPR